MFDLEVFSAMRKTGGRMTTIGVSIPLILVIALCVLKFRNEVFGLKVRRYLRLHRAANDFAHAQTRENFKALKESLHQLADDRDYYS
jgi:hypothetical protein